MLEENSSVQYFWPVIDSRDGVISAVLLCSRADVMLVSLSNHITKKGFSHAMNLRTFESGDYILMRIASTIVAF